MKTRVLVIDDDASIRDSVSKVLRRENYEVLAAIDGLDAATRFELHPIDIILVDVRLMNRTGWDAVELLIARNGIPPVIIIADHSIQPRFSGALCVSAFLEKPIDAITLLDTIRFLVARPKQRAHDCPLERGARPTCVALDDEEIFADLRARSMTPFRWQYPAPVASSPAIAPRHRDRDEKSKWKGE